MDTTELIRFAVNLLGLCSTVEDGRVVIPFSACDTVITVEVDDDDDDVVRVTATWLPSGATIGLIEAVNGVNGEVNGPQTYVGTYADGTVGVEYGEDVFRIDPERARELVSRLGLFVEQTLEHVMRTAAVLAESDAMAEEINRICTTGAAESETRSD